MRTVFWAAGVKATRSARRWACRSTAAGRVIVGPDLTIPGHPEVFVVGDMAAAKSATPASRPGVAAGRDADGPVRRPDASPQKSRASTPARREPFRYFDKGSMAVIGKDGAVSGRKFYFSGFLAWLMWAGVHIAFLIGFRNRIPVLMSWFWNWLFNSRDARLITGDARLEIHSPAPASLCPTRRPRRSSWKRRLCPPACDQCLELVGALTATPCTRTGTPSVRAIRIATRAAISLRAAGCWCRN